MKNQLFNSVNHKGRVVSIMPRMISVRIETSSLCASCHAKGACTAADKADKIIDIEYFGEDVFEVGEVVNVIMHRSLGLKAVLFSYVIPLIILLFLLLSLQVMQFSELASGLFSLIGVLLYYGILLLLRKRIAGKFVFKIEKQ